MNLSAESSGQDVPEMVAVGRILNETIVFADGSTQSVLGSPAAYSSVCAARLGTWAAVVTRIGCDFPDGLLEVLREAGVDMRGVVREGDASTTNRLVYRPDGTKIIEYMEQSPPITRQDVPAAYRGAPLFYVCPMDFDVAPDELRAIKGMGEVLAGDLGGYGGAHSPPAEVPQLERDPEGTRGIVGAFDIVKASVEDCCRMTGEADVDVEALSSEFRDWGAGIVVITLAEEGAYLRTPDAGRLVPAFRGSAIDPTGGGDSFVGGFLSEYLRTRDPERSAGFAAMTALMVIEGTGGVRIERFPTRRDVERRLRDARVA